MKRFAHNLTMIFSAAVALTINIASAQDLTMFNANSQAGLSIAGTAAMNSAICNQTGTCGRSQSPAAKALEREFQERKRQCNSDVIQNTQSGTPARKAGYARCDADDYARRNSAGSQVGYADNRGQMQGGSTGYRPSFAVSNEVKHAVLASVNNTNMRNPASVNRLINGQDVEALFDGLMNQHGLRSRDLADAMTGYWLTMWMIVHQTEMPGRAIVDGVRMQMRDASISNGFTNQPDAFKQREAQTLMWQMTLALAAYRNPQMDRRGLSQVLNSNARQQGFDLASLDVTRAGFVAR